MTVAGATAGEVSVTIGASAADVYAMISDVTRMGEWSPECRRCEWVDDTHTEFRGHNRVGPWRWSTTAKVVVSQPAVEFAFTVVVKGRDATRWRYRFDEAEGGTVLTESYEAVWAPWYFALGDRIVRRDRALMQGMRATVDRVKAKAEN